MSENSSKIDMRCDKDKKCSGCQLGNMTYEKQLKWKQTMVYRLLRQFGTVKKIAGMTNPYHYRNKQQFVFKKAKNGRVICGLYQSKSQGVVENFDCLINNRRACEIAKTITSLLQSADIKIYSPKNGSGRLKHMLIKTGNSSGEIMVCFVCAKKTFSTDSKFIQSLLGKCPDITTITEIVNTNSSGVFVDGDESVIFGDGYITDSLCGLNFKISARSFYQVNPLQAEQLYNCAIEKAKLKKGELLLDAYSGVGTIGIIAAAKTGAEVLSVELNRAAAEDAVCNAKLNGVENISFANEDAGEYIQRLADTGRHIDCIIADPPRAGCSRAFLQSLLNIAPQRVIYISCNPKTLQRDLYFLTQNGYSAEFVKPFDMFPFTNHCEVCCLITRDKNKYTKREK